MVTVLPMITAPSARNRRDGCGIAPWCPARPQGRAEFGRHVAGIENVLNADRNPMQRSNRPALLALAVRDLRLAQGMVAVEEGPGLHLGINLIDTGEAAAHEFDRRNPAFANVRGRLRKPE